MCESTDPHEIVENTKKAITANWNIFSQLRVGTVTGILDSDMLHEEAGCAIDSEK